MSSRRHFLAFADCLIFAVLTALVLSLLLAHTTDDVGAYGAPAPLPKPAKAPAHVAENELWGCWYFNWCDEEATNSITFCIDGTLTETYNGQQWWGKWRFDADEQRLHVEDQTMNSALISWYVDFKRKGEKITGTPHKFRR